MISLYIPSIRRKVVSPRDRLCSDFQPGKLPVESWARAG